MVDVGQKAPTQRRAVAEGAVAVSSATLEAIRHQESRKGNVLEVARLAGILAAKQTDRLIPLCHSLPLDAVSIQFELPAAPAVEPAAITIQAEVRTTARTGVEMEAMTAVSVAALTIYDMCKAMDRSMEILKIRLLEKSGGASGSFRREEPPVSGE